MPETYTDLSAIEAQKEREIEYVDRGVKLYYEKISKAKSVSELPPVRRMYREILDRLIPSIKSLHDDTLESLNEKAAKGGRLTGIEFPLLCLNPSKQAFITLKYATDCAMGGYSKSKTLASDNLGYIQARSTHRCGNMIGKAIKMEREFELWQDAEREKSKEDTNAVNLAEIMKRRVKNLTPRNVGPWMRRAETYDKLDWENKTCSKLGVTLLGCLIDCAPGWFECPTVWVRGMKIRYIKMTDEASDALADAVYDEALRKPRIAPMICPPKPWKWSEE